MIMGLYQGPRSVSPTAPTVTGMCREKIFNGPSEPRLTGTGNASGQLECPCDAGHDSAPQQVWRPKPSPCHHTNAPVWERRCSASAFAVATNSSSTPTPDFADASKKEAPSDAASARPSAVGTRRWSVLSTLFPTSVRSESGHCSCGGRMQG